MLNVHDQLRQVLPPILDVPFYNNVQISRKMEKKKYGPSLVSHEWMWLNFFFFPLYEYIIFFPLITKPLNCLLEKMYLFLVSIEIQFNHVQD